MSEVVKLVTAPKMEVVEQLRSKHSNWESKIVPVPAPIRFFEPDQPTQNELLAVARQHDRTIKARWAI